MERAVRNYKPARIVPFELYNIDDFVVNEYPVYHPLYEQDLYTEYWDNQLETCLQGKWGLDKNDKGQGGYRWMPGNLYFYINMTQIKIEEDEGRESYAPPSLRDIEWFIFYALIVCDGFSGFADDEEFTCYEPVGKMQGKIVNKKGKKVTKLLNKEKIRLKRYDEHLRKPNGEYKTYIDPQEYLYRVFDKPMGRALYFNEMKNLVILSSRGVGKSYSISNGVLQYDFTFGSARTVQEFKEQQHPSVSVAGSFDSKKTDALLKKFEDSYEFMRSNVGAFTDESGSWNGYFYHPYDGSIKVGKNISNRIKEEGGRSFTGTGSELWHVSYKDNASAGVGFRARRMVVEEAGLLSNFKQVHAENSGTQMRETKIGYTVYIGTGGDIEKIQGIRDAFYNPKGYDCVSFRDVFSNKPKSIGLFIPAYYRSIDYKDPQGNTRLEEAFEDEMTIRESKRLEGSTAYEGHIISYPIVPQEMFLQSSNNIFPTDLLEDNLTDLETGRWDKMARAGKLTYTNKERTRVYWEPLDIDSCPVIKRYGDEKDFDDQQKAGTIVVYEPPVLRKPELTHYKFMYMVTYDSIRDEEGGSSLACVQVWKFWDFDDLNNVQFNLVAEWVGRHIGTGGLERDHEVAFKLAAYYDAPIMPEINLKDVLRHGRQTHRYRYFLPKPALALDGMEIDVKGNYPVGLKIVPGMKPDLERYLNEALHTVVDSSHEIVGEQEIVRDVKMVSQIPSMRLTEELLYYNRDDNFDSVSSAFLFGVVARQRLLEPVDEHLSEDEHDADDDYANFLNNGEERLGGFNDGHPAFNY